MSPRHDRSPRREIVGWWYLNRGRQDGEAKIDIRNVERFAIA